jgi:ribose 5-phosphate isomerase B
MRIVIGSDHAGYVLKKYLVERLTQEGHSLEDVGVYSDQSADYPLIAKSLCERLSNRPGILLCRTGQGMAMAANRWGVRAIVGYSEQAVILGREHEDAQVLCLASDYISSEQCIGFCRRFLETNFSNEGRHRRRIQQLQGIHHG